MQYQILVEKINGSLNCNFVYSLKHQLLFSVLICKAHVIFFYFQIYVLNFDKIYTSLKKIPLLLNRNFCHDVETLTKLNFSRGLLEKFYDVFNVF